MMDDSGSMDWDYLPDEVKQFDNNTYGRLSSYCNGMYYDPTITYRTPVEMTLPANTFDAALNDGYKLYNVSTNPKANFSTTPPTAIPLTYTSGGRTNSNPAPMAPIYYQYIGTETRKDYLNTGSDFYKACNTSVTSTTTPVLFTKTDLRDSKATAADKQNFVYLSSISNECDENRYGQCF
jgi:type IV pilus assembly protein PilY1